MIFLEHFYRYCNLNNFVSIMITMTMMMTLPITITTTITTTAQDCRMLKGITMMIIVLLMKACIESSRDISFVFLPLSAWITTEGIYNNINNNYYFTYIYLYIITGSFDRRWSRFFYVKFYLHNNNNKYMIIPRFLMERGGFSPIFFISGSAAAIERGELCSCAIDYESGGICRCISYWFKIHHMMIITITFTTNPDPIFWICFWS